MMEGKDTSKKTKASKKAAKKEKTSCKSQEVNG